MSDQRIEGYARGLFEIARAESNLDEVEDELFRFARSLETNEQLRSTLSNELLPAASRQAIVEDLLGSRATRTTTQLTPKRFCAICAQTTFVLSPLVATTTASARSMPAASNVWMSSESFTFLVFVESQSVVETDH